MLGFLRNKRSIMLLCVDFAIMIVASLLAFSVANVVISSIIKTHIAYDFGLFFLMGCMLLGMWFAGVYRHIWRFAIVGDFLSCGFGIFGGTALFYIIILLSSLETSDILAVLTVLASLVGIIMSRVCYSYLYRYLKAVRYEDNGVKTLIVGAGDAGNRIILEMLANRDSRYKPTVIVDDDRSKKGRKLHGITVVGTTGDIPKIVEKYNIKIIMIAMPSASGDDKKRILNICSETVCEVKNIPYIHELIGDGNLLGQIRKISVEDLLGRDVITMDDDNVESLIRDSVCMVTGGGGSIGSELSRQIASFEPKKLVIVDIYENSAYDIQQELLMRYGKKLDLEVHIASVRDLDKMEKLFSEIQPDLVFHAAAHKHVPLMETDPEEAIKNNVRGTYNCAKLAKKYNVRKFVLVSTDKAVNPTNVMGATKRCCEMIVQYFAQQGTATEYVAVRFGNVLGSNGSVIPLFEKQIADGGPITVTHPDVIRYFMTIPEAVALILQAGSMAKGGEIFVLDMGEPVRILSLAENLIRLHGKEPYVDIAIKFSGLRPGEKLFEELLMDEEGLKKTENEKIFIGKQIEIDPESFKRNMDDMCDTAFTNDSDAVVAKLRELVPTFNHVVINR